MILSSYSHLWCNCFCFLCVGDVHGEWWGEYLRSINCTCKAHFQGLWILYIIMYSLTFGEDNEHAWVSCSKHRKQTSHLWCNCLCFICAGDVHGVRERWGGYLVSTCKAHFQGLWILHIIMYLYWAVSTPAPGRLGALRHFNTSTYCLSVEMARLFQHPYWELFKVDMTFACA